MAESIAEKLSRKAVDEGDAYFVSDIKRETKKSNKGDGYIRKIVYKHLAFSLSFSFFPMLVIYVLYKCNVYFGLPENIVKEIVGKAWALYVPGMFILGSILFTYLFFLVFGNRQMSSIDMKVKSAALDKIATTFHLIGGAGLSLAIMMSIEKNYVNYLLLALIWPCCLYAATSVEVLKDYLEDKRKSSRGALNI